ncbi:MAG: AmmeMemoRadiSam system protein B [Cyanobacteria bacterium REEB67]|nr:AmmeMemoRadiSam system protein B [Cyanobacteria bacterium REEB67]
MFRLANKRPLKFAGSWYEADPKRLATQLDQYNSGAQSKVSSFESQLNGQAVLAVVAPHAGYAFSGQTAACSYMAPEGKKIKRVFLLGPSHYVGFPGAAVTSDKSFATVFGDLSVDVAAVSALQKSGEFHELQDVHRQEHSLEMQLAFIKRDFGNVKIVPILIGRLDSTAEAKQVASHIKRLLRDGDLIAVSSDFTHFGPRYGYTPFKGDFSDNLKKLDMEAFSYLQNNDLDGFFSFYKRTDDTICGVYALTVLLALLPAEARGHLIDYRTSRDSIVEDAQNSVSYLSIAFASPQSWSAVAASAKNSEPLSLSDKRTLLALAKATLAKCVAKGDGEAPAYKSLGVEVSERLRQEQGVFVTLFKKMPAVDDPGHDATKTSTTGGARQGKELRGCIGYIMPVKPLYQAVIDNATAAATRDHRFTPLQPDELEHLEIEISVLTNPYPVAGPSEIRVGTDGVLLFCQGRQSVFLPHVATEFGWNLDETLSQLAIKAGLPRQAWKSADAQFEVFQAESIDSKDFED